MSGEREEEEVRKNRPDGRRKREGKEGKKGGRERKREEKGRWRGEGERGQIGRNNMKCLLACTSISFIKCPFDPCHKIWHMDM